MGIRISKVEEIGKGVALCELMKRIDDGLYTFKPNPWNQCDYLYNLRQVKLSLERNGIKIPFPMERMINLKMQDNLEVLQHLYREITSRNLIRNEINNKEQNTINEKIDKINEKIDRSKELRILDETEKLKEKIDILREERDFYFKKLLQIEKLVKDDSEKTNDYTVDKYRDLQEKVMKILYRS